MYFKLLYRSGHVNQVRCIYSVSAWNSCAKTFASALAFAIYCHSQKDNCDTLNQAAIRLAPPSPLWLFITPSYQLCVANSWYVQTTLSVLQGAHAIKSIDAVCHWVQVKKHTKWNFVLKFGFNLEFTNLILPQVRILDVRSCRCYSVIIPPHPASIILSWQNYENSLVPLECCFTPFAKRSQCVVHLNALAHNTSLRLHAVAEPSPTSTKL